MHGFVVILSAISVSIVVVVLILLAIISSDHSSFAVALGEHGLRSRLLVTPIHVPIAIVVRYVAVAVAKFGLETIHNCLAAALLQLLIVIIIVQTRLQQLVHFVLVCTLVIQPAAIVVIPLVHVNWCIAIAIVFVIVKHALEPAFLLLLELVLAAQVARSNFDARS